MAQQQVSSIAGIVIVAADRLSAGRYVPWPTWRVAVVATSAIVFVLLLSVLGICWRKRRARMALNGSRFLENEATASLHYRFTDASDVDDK
jgi:uncharacterized membrane protein YqjE